MRDDSVADSADLTIPVSFARVDVVMGVEDVVMGVEEAEMDVVKREVV